MSKPRISCTRMYSSKKEALRDFNWLLDQGCSKICISGATGDWKLQFLATEKQLTRFSIREEVEREQCQ